MEGLRQDGRRGLTNVRWAPLTAAGLGLGDCDPTVTLADDEALREVVIQARHTLIF